MTIAEIQASTEITREQDVETAHEIEASLNRVTETCNLVPADHTFFVAGLN